MSNKFPDLKALISDSNLASAPFLEQFSNQENKSLYNALIGHHIMSEHALQSLFKKELGCEISSLKNVTIDPKLAKNMSNQSYIPLYETQDKLAIAVSNPYEITDISAQKEVEITLIPNHELQAYNNSNTDDFSALELITTAFNQHASDIHTYEQEDHSGIIYFRIQGNLSPFAHISEAQYTQLKHHLKLDAHLGLSVSPKPQEGHIRWTLSQTRIDTRISIIPTLHGEDIACRLFNQTHTYETFSDLGIPSKNDHVIKELCNHTNGLILVTGPTGSGKTTTLYTLLRYLQTQSKQNIITLEDPIEKELYGIRQTNIKPESGFTYAAGLKAILRQDPDIIMIGEIRDAETAQIALEAAYTGHLVLSSLHTNDVYSTLLRLKQFKCDDFLIQYVLRGIIAQKLKNTPSDSQSSRSLDQEILAIPSPTTIDMSTLTNLENLGTYIPYAN